MKKIIITLCSLIFLLTGCMSDDSRQVLRLWYDQPASVWEEALPLGNGRLGAMVFGNPLEELYQLNEETLWSDYPRDWNNPKAVSALPLVRKAVNDGDYVKAREIWKANAQGPYSARFLPLADLKLHMNQQGTVTNLYRDLNLNDAISTVSYEADGVHYIRSSFISFPDQVMVIRISADKRKAISMSMGLTSSLHYSNSVNDNTLVLRGKAPSHVAHRAHEPQQVVYDPNGEGMDFEVQAQLIPSGGEIERNDSTIAVQNADEVLILLSAATSYNGPDKSPGHEGIDPSPKASSFLKAAAEKNYPTLLKRHVDDYQSLFNRVSLSLGTQVPDTLPTDRRLMRFNESEVDQGMVVLYYQYVRYLTISSSREGGIPTNLQGIWNRHVQPPWGCNFTNNINLEMNYWPVESSNLSECFDPLEHFIQNLARHGAVTAKVNYGMETGWVGHHNSDIWAQSAPSGGYDWDPSGNPKWSCWPMSGVWLCQHLWEHYAYNGDLNFLKETAYPLMKGAVAFMLQWLQQDEESGYWLTNPSTSPENDFIYINKKGERTVGDVTKASTMDITLARDLFENFLQTSKILGEKEYVSEVQEVLPRLLPFLQGSKGQLQEWMNDFEDQDPHHRHVSHLFGLYPGKQIQPRRDNALAKACKQTLLIRGDGGTGWSMAWKINLWARLEDGNHAYQMLRNGLTYYTSTIVSTLTTGGTYPNLFCAHPPFQIDGNFGSLAGINEMLLQSHTGELFLLPALPDAWANGKICGLKARGGFIIDMEWKDKQLTYVRIYSTKGGKCRIRSFVPLNGNEPTTEQLPMLFTGESPAFLPHEGAPDTDLPLKTSYVTEINTVPNQAYELKIYR